MQIYEKPHWIQTFSRYGMELPLYYKLNKLSMTHRYLAIVLEPSTRFGKSCKLYDTELFSGPKELFQGLAIEN
jgi:hypothetical protein